ncbi:MULTISPECIES: DarT ssDNA thymidine ADP-ribosyltransferase family protein [unclassified Bacteroides]|uniref:DarT ssDNA thymidine ADP-ribosyltransferase family protein n=1 Tax=unclassified Bacteroides TaxID=2646097 RepID=UPI0013EAA566|nr:MULTISPECIES: DarT ssDNA thymidine ADP-ribosyltransferase family protein [unclassified Bacteroides]QTO26765.1 DUF4433 domain-containing protein [Bacteroides sp. ZJ-18]
MLFEWIKKVFGFDKPISPYSKGEIGKSSSKINILEGRRKDVVSTRNSMKTVSVNWYHLTPKENKSFKEVSIFVRYSFPDIVTVKFLKEQRLRKEQERLVALEDQLNKDLLEIKSLISRKKLNEADKIFDKVQSIISQIHTSHILQQYKEVQNSILNLRETLEKREIQRIAEEREKKENIARKKRKEQECRQREIEEKQRKENEVREGAAKRLAEQARQKEIAEKAERDRLNSLCNEKKLNIQSFKDILTANGITCFYHFTDRRNLLSIKKQRGLLSWHYCKTHGIVIPNQGGDADSENLDMRYGLQDYVRLSFCDDHPMTWRLKQSGSNLVLLRIKIDVAWFKETLFSDINAADQLHSHGGDLCHLQKVNFAATKRHYVNRNDEDFKPHQAEVMVKTFIPLEYIINIDNPILI